MVEHKRTEKITELDEELELYKFALGKADDVICLIAPDGGFKFFNDAACRKLGYSKRELSTMGVQDVDPLFQEEQWKKHWSELKRKGSLRLETFHKRKDGSIYSVEVSANYFMYGDKEYNLAFARDITERKRAEEALEQRARRIQQLLDAFPCFAMLLNADREVVAANKVARGLGAVIGKQCFDKMTPFDIPCAWCRADIALANGEFQRVQTWGGGVYWDAYWIPLEKNLYLHFAFDITEAKMAEEKIEHSLREKEVLLKEIHHRVKNNMGVIASLLQLQAAFVKDKDDYEMFMESRNRIRSMSLIHDRLYRSENFVNIDFTSYIETLIKDLLHAYSVDQDNISYKIRIDGVTLGIDDAIPCGLILNELVSNAIKHAFPGKAKGEIEVQMSSLDNDNIKLVVRDNGIGFPEDLDMKDPKTFGLQVAKTLAMQLRGVLTLRKGGGAVITLVFPKSSNKERRTT